MVNRKICQNHIGSAADPDTGQREPPVHLPLILSAPAPHGNHPYDHRNNTDCHNDQLIDSKIIGKQGQSFGQCLQVLCIKRRDPL